MRNKIYLMIVMLGVIQALSCKKDSRSQQQQPQQSPVASLGSGLTSFSINGQLLPATIDTAKNLITVVLPHTMSFKNLTINFSLTNGVNATINDAGVTSGSTVDFSKLVYFTITSADKKRSSNFEVSAQTDLFFEGITNTLVAENSLKKNYNYYFDQFDGSTWQAINCGPTVATMVVKWSDSTFNKTPGDARAVYEPNGGWWSTRNVSDYLGLYGLTLLDEPLTNLDSIVKVNIDNSRPLVLCVDAYYIETDNVTYHHVDKYYPSEAIGTGHFLLVKGYLQTVNGFYLQIDDPWSQNLTYFPTIMPKEPFGEDRYYLDTDIHTALENWDPSIYIVAPRSETNSITRALNGKPRPFHIAYGR